MPVLREDSVLIMDGAVKLYRRERSRKWQAAFQIDGQYIRISTGKSDLDEAKQAASDSYLEYKFRQKNGVLSARPQSSRFVRSVLYKKFQSAKRALSLA